MPFVFFTGNLGKMVRDTYIQVKTHSHSFNLDPVKVKTVFFLAIKVINQTWISNCLMEKDQTRVRSNLTSVVD
uniref:Uncharacterized protein n=1 Tax=Rhizophora mucronata TaxID=61149 RepID=A0A2P2PL32_RHIMU